MRNIKLVLEYNGSTFFGFQRQPGKPTIQDALEKALSTLFNHKMKITAASGRTDAGVHAEGQVVNFKTSSDRDVKRIQKGLNALLPRPVVIKKIEAVHPDFHARYSARSKVYEYRIWNHQFRSPILAERAYHVPYHLNLAAMRKAAKYFIGRHDFRSFTSASMVLKGKTRANFIRTIKTLMIKKLGYLILFHIEADGFLYHMVRNMVGTLLEVGRGKRKTDEIKVILAAKNRKFAGMKVPSQGLTLIRVTY